MNRLKQARLTADKRMRLAADEMIRSLAIVFTVSTPSSALVPAKIASRRN